MFELIEKMVGEKEAFANRYRGVRKYFEDILSYVPDATQPVNVHGETSWMLKFDFKHNERKYELKAETLPTKKKIQDAEIKLTLCAQNFRNDSVEEWLTPLDGIENGSETERLQKILPDLEIIVEALKNLPGMRPGYL
jgi:hypothetical protein